MCILICTFQLTVYADLLVFPGDPSGRNDYFDNHIHRSLTPIGQDYQVPNGMTVTLYESPESGGILKTMTAGDIITIAYQLELNETIWGIGRAYPDTGWVRLGRLQKIYSHEDFLSDYDPDIKQPILAFLDVSQFTEPIYVWTYPGSGVLKETLDPEFFTPEHYHEGLLEYRKLYTDPDGDHWGYVGYFMGQCNGWIFLDDLHNPEPEFHLNPVLKNTVTDTNPIEEEPKPPLISTLLRLSLLIIPVMVATAAVIYVLKRKNP